VRRFIAAACLAAAVPVLAGCAGPQPVDESDDDDASVALVADPGPDQEAHVGELVTLDAGGSTGPDPALLTYAWDFDTTPAGSVADLENVDAVATTFVPDLIGVYVARLTVSDGTDSDTATVAVVAQPLPEVPSLEPIDDQVTGPGTATHVPIEVLADGPEVSVDATSNDQLLLPDDAITVHGEPGDRWLELLPDEEGIGEVGVTVIVRDAAGRGSSVEFVLRVGAVFPLVERLPDDLAPPQHPDRFGASVAISGPRALVGVPGSDHGGSGSGVVHAYARGEDGWDEVGLIEPTAPPVQTQSVAGLHFGSSVALSGNRAVVGAPRSADGGAPGHAYFFTRCNPFFTMCPQPYVQDAVVSGDASDDHDGFGSAVAIDGDLVVIGAPLDEAQVLRGAAYVYRLGTEGWTLEQKLLTPEDFTHVPRFGRAVAVSGDRILVADQTAAHVFEPADGEWQRTARLVPNPFSAQRSIDTVALDGDRLAIGGSRRSSDPYLPSVYLFEDVEGAGFEQVGRVTVGDTSEPPIGIGPALALKGTALLVGVPWAPVETLENRGAIDVYADFEDGWTFLHRVAVDDLPANSYLGYSLALDGGRAIAGAPGVVDAGGFGGAAFGLGD
jgi:hypothetical protein